MAAYSRPTRQGSIASTASVYSSSEQDLDTPLDEDFSLNLSFHKGQTNVAPLNPRFRGDEESEEKYPTTSPDVPRNRFTINSSSTVHLSEEPDPYYSSTSPPDPQPTLDYRKSTRELVSRYEAISSTHPTPLSKRSAVTPFHTPPNASQRLNSPLPELPGLVKPKGQTHFSFRNILSVFGKKSKGPSIAQSVSVPITPINGDICSPKTRRDDRTRSLSAFFAFRTGPALYLSSATSPPSWHPCSLTLHPSYLALTYSQDARHIAHTIPLLFCMDVRSLASHQLDEDLPAPAANMGFENEPDKKAYVFEMSFEGCEPIKERLAVWSVAERGRWVSATWDAILACRDPSKPHNDTGASSPHSFNGISPEPPLRVVNHTGQSVSSTSSQHVSTPPRSMQDQTITRDAPSPTSSVSLPSTSTRCRQVAFPDSSSTRSSLPSSSSIQTLGSMSIVQQRLAKIDGQQPLTSTTSLSRASSICTGSYFASSLKRRNMGAGQDDRPTLHSATSRPSERLERHATSASRLSHYEPKTPFTALDTHALYHQLRPDVSATDVVENAYTQCAGGIGSETRRSLEKREILPYTKRPESWSEGLSRPKRFPLKDEFGQPDPHSGRISRSGDQDSKSQAQGSEHTEGGVRSLAELFHAHAAEQSSQASDLADKLASLDEGVNTVAANLRHLCQGTSGVDLVPVHTKLDQITEGINAFDPGTVRQLVEGVTSMSRSNGAQGYTILLQKLDKLQASGQPPNVDLSHVLAKLEELRLGINGDLPLVLQMLDNLKMPGAASTDITLILNKLEDIKVAVEAQHGTSTTLNPEAAPAIDLTDIHAKLDGLVSLCTTLTNRSTMSTISAVGGAGNELIMRNISRSEDSPKRKHYDGSETTTAGEKGSNVEAQNPIIDSAQIVKLLEMLKDDETGRAVQAQQQADSVRYLNELNSWLESFVTNSMGQMQQVSAGVDQLCREWLPVAAVQPIPGGDENKNLAGSNNVFASLQRFLADHEERSQETRHLQATMHGLTEVLKEEMAKNAEARFEMVRHAQLQESLMNGLAAKLTTEIRGERLRFVDAMQEATSVNVENHVEDFKKVLARLHQEKKDLEQQIADLFSFVAKQRQGGIAVSRPANQATLEVPQASRRPLPQIINR